jgi:hypothetical protein
MRIHRLRWGVLSLAILTAWLLQAPPGTGGHYGAISVGNPYTSNSHNEKPHGVPRREP